MQKRAEALLILASGSARRQALLRDAGVDFDLEIADVDEAKRAGEGPRAYAERLAEAKARAGASRRRPRGDWRPVLGADTIVVIDGEAVGKPGDRHDARRMLERLSDRLHQVITSFCVIASDNIPRIHTVTTEVTFAALDAQAIERYLDRAAWHDKAGAYAVQEHAAFMVRAIRGSYTNVVGLPLCEAIDALRTVGVTPQ